MDYSGTSPIQTIRQWIYNGSTGSTSAGITTTASALAPLDNGVLHMSQWKGQSLAGSFSQVLIVPALRGDANLDGAVDAEDQLAVFANLGKTGATWLNGDVNNDGTVNLVDLALTQSGMTMTLNQSLETSRETVSKATTKTTPTDSKSRKHKTVKKTKNANRR
jgi:hypothetical protein